MSSNCVIKSMKVIDTPKPNKVPKSKVTRLSSKDAENQKARKLFRGKLSYDDTLTPATSHTTVIDVDDIALADLKMHSHDVQEGEDPLPASEENTLNGGLMGQLSKLRAAALTGDKHTLRNLLNGDPSLVNAADGYGRTAVMYACLGDRHDIITWLTKKGAALNAKDNRRRTSLHWAAHKGSFNSVRVLLKLMDAKAASLAVLQSDSQKVTPVHLAARLANNRTLQVLLNFILLEDCQLECVDSGMRSALHYAAAAGNLEGVIQLTKHKLTMHIDAVDSVGRTAFLYAVTYSSPANLQCAKKLLQLAPWGISQQDEHGLGCMHLAAINDNKATLQWLLDPSRKNRVDVADNMFRTPLHWAARLELFTVCEYLIQAGASIDLRDKNGATPAHYAAITDNPKIVNLLLKREITLNKKTDDSENSAVCGNEVQIMDPLDKSGRSTLMWAGGAGANKSIVAILNLRTNPECVRSQLDHRGCTALHMACMAGKDRTADLLIQRGWGPQVQDILGMTPFLVAVERGSWRTAQILLKAGVNIMHVDGEGRSALHWAALGGYTFICQQLMRDYGMHPLLVDYGGRTPLHCAAFSGFSGCVSVFLQAGGDVECRDHADFTPLHLAAATNSVQVVNVLLEHDPLCVNVLAPADSKGLLTPTDLALLNNADQCVDLLMDKGGMSYGALKQCAAIKIQAFYRGYALRKNSITYRM